MQREIMRRIETAEDVTRALDALVARDPRLGPVRKAAGAVPLRRSPAGFASLASVIVSQQVSRASADAIFGRLCRFVDPLTPETLLACGEGAMVAAGLSRAKQRALMALAGAIAGGSLDLALLKRLPAEEATAALVAVPGIGPWTAQAYLLIATGHADIFPSGDVALQAAVARGLCLKFRPDARTLMQIAESWSPWRSVAARLFWAYYREMKGVEAAPAA